MDTAAGSRDCTRQVRGKLLQYSEEGHSTKSPSAVSGQWWRGTWSTSNFTCPIGGVFTTILPCWSRNYWRQRQPLRAFCATSWVELLETSLTHWGDQIDWNEQSTDRTLPCCDGRKGWWISRPLSPMRLPRRGGLAHAGGMLTQTSKRTLLCRPWSFLMTYILFQLDSGPNLRIVPCAWIVVSKEWNKGTCSETA